MRWFSLDHRVIGLQYAITSMAFLLIGFELMMLLRWQLAYPMQPIHLPVGRPVIVQLSARDVIHSFGVAAMRVKQDAIPGMMSPVWFTPTLEGTFDIACSQLCGLAHYRMRGVITVEGADAFAAWLSSQR